MITVKQLGPGDEDELARFAEAFDDPIDRRATEEFLADARHHLFVGYADDEPAGFLTATQILHPDKPRAELFLNEIAVIEAHRRKGVARALIEALRALVRELGYRGFYVLTGIDDERAQAMYASTGGVREEPPNVLFWYDPDTVPDASA